MSSLHPFQSVRRISRKDASGVRELVIAACGSRLHSLWLSRGDDSSSIVVSWPSPTPVAEADEGNEGPPSKKRKVDDVGSEAKDIIQLEIAPDQRHVVLVTGVDKCIRVLAINDKGHFEELSQRCMPKRPCALQITEDSSTIICGDKFGDVYSLPLIAEPASQQPVSIAANGEKPKVESYRPAATELTVHTKRNLRALEDQLKQKAKAKAREPLAFNHKLLLGHVAMLTDLRLAATVHEGRRWDFIITCDRDEHIRVSRGPPQAYVIDNFCLGHKEFVHRVRLIPGTDLLVSGGGDDWLGVWQWTTGALVAKKDLKGIGRERSKDKIAVRDIWVLSTESDEHVVVVQCEGVEGLTLIASSSLTDSGVSPQSLSLPEHGAVLDILDLGSGRLIVSTDGAKRLRGCKLRFSGQAWEFQSDADLEEALKALNELQTPRPTTEALETLLGNAEKLRKRDHEQEQEGDD